MSTPSPDEGIAFPDVHEAILDPPTLDRLFADLRAHTEVLDVLVKGGRFARADRGSVPLERARELIEGGQAFAVQIRYRWDGAEWRDTLLRTPEGIRVVRIQPG